MGYSPYRIGIATRVGALAVTLFILAWVLAETHWYVTAGLLVAATAFEIWLLVRFAEGANREVARFLDALSFDDVSQTFTGLSRDRTPQAPDRSPRRAASGGAGHVLRSKRTIADGSTP